MPFTISKDVAWREVGGELFVITPDGLLHGVRSAAGLFIWRQLERGIAERDIVASLCEHFDVTPADARRDLDEFISTMLHKGLIMARE